MAAAGLTGPIASGVFQPSEPMQPIPPDGVPATGVPEAAKEAEPETVVLLRDGRRVTGFLVAQTVEGVTLRVGGLQTRLAADLIDRVEIQPPVAERYRAMREAIDPSDPDQLVQLAEWLRSRALYDDAIAELTRALSLKPGHAEAARLLLLVRGQRELAARSGRTRTDAPRRPTPEPARNRAEFPVLSPDQINSIKIYEVDLKDPPDLLVPRETITRLLDAHAGDPAIPPTQEGRDQIYRLPPAGQLELIFKLQARELYPQVQVLSQPRSMLRFRDDVHRPWIMNSCATTRCHGGAEAGRLFLNNRRPNSEATVYTNFLILDRFRLPDGSPLIDFEQPARSPLLHMALPRRESLFPHPSVPGPDGRGDLWRPVIRSAEDRRFIQAVEWMKAMYRPRPAYPVDYQPPEARPASAALPGNPPPRRP